MLHLLRSTRAKLFLKSDGDWTRSAQRAQNFGSTEAAVRACQTQGLKEMELVLRFDEKGKYDIAMKLWSANSPTH